MHFEYYFILNFENSSNFVDPVFQNELANFFKENLLTCAHVFVHSNHLSEDGKRHSTIWGWTTAWRTCGAEPSSRNTSETNSVNTCTGSCLKCETNKCEDERFNTPERRCLLVFEVAACL